MNVLIGRKETMVCSVLFMSEYLQVLKACFVKKHFLRLHQLFFS